MKLKSNILKGFAIALALCAGAASARGFKVRGPKLTTP